MIREQPPALATWLLNWAARGNEALIGDLLEEYRRGRSAVWYWKQVLTAVVVGRLKGAALALGVAAIYVLGSYVSIPGADASMRALLERRAVGAPYRLFDVVVGGQLTGITIFALGINPYISAAFIVQAAALVWRFLQQHSAMPRPLPVVAATWCLAILFCATEAAGLAAFLERVSLAHPGLPIVFHPGWTFRITTLLTLTAGTTTLMLLSDQISKRRFGNGMFLVFGAGIMVSLGGAIPPLLEGQVDPFGILAPLAFKTMVTAVVSHGYRRAIERELPA